MTEAQRDIVYQAIQTSHVLECDLCGHKEELHQCDDTLAWIQFLKKGWTAQDDHIVYCPKCSKDNTDS